MNMRREERISLNQLHAFARLALIELKVPASHAATTATVLTMTDSWGVFTHGTKLLRGYAHRLRGGGLRSDVSPVVTSEGPAWAIVDGQSGLGQVTSTFAMEQAIGKAQAAGVAYVGVRNSCHFGAAGYYAWMAACQGMIGLAICE